MTLESLRCFCAVVEHASFRAAAEHLNRSQPAVSQQLKALEGELGHTLIDRKQGSATPLGQLLYERARRILLSVESLGCEVADFEAGVGRELRVGTSDTTAMYILPARVRQFAELYPETRLVLVHRGSEAIAEQVLSGGLDLGIVTLPKRQVELDSEQLFEEQFVLAMPADHPLANRAEVELTALRYEPLLLIHPETRTGAHLQAWFEREDFTPQVVLDSGSFAVIKRYIREGVGLSFLPDAALHENTAGLATAVMPGLPKVAIGAVWRRDTYQSKAARAFLDLLRTR